MHYKESAGRLFELLIQNSTSSEFRKFLYRSRSTVLVTLLIVSASDDNLCSLEDILERIPRKLVSRTSVKYILDEGVNQKFYAKVKDSRDNRRRVYSLNPKYQQEILNLMESYQEIFKRVESISKGK
jgi:DNA-binding MarR family transcriptional regulator|tara:strand:- start:1260 stop:1640 length:381 start_codon:yes stop_codon:yes gene_type:complete